jgi:hypothetical protein
LSLAFEGVILRFSGLMGGLGGIVVDGFDRKLDITSLKFDGSSHANEITF